MAAKGDADAQYNLGLIYEKGKGVPENDAVAVSWYRKAAEQGHVEAQKNLLRLGPVHMLCEKCRGNGGPRGNCDLCGGSGFVIA